MKEKIELLKNLTSLVTEKNTPYFNVEWITKNIFRLFGIYRKSSRKRQKKEWWF